MKLAARDLAGFLRRPDPRAAAVLVSGEDGARVREAREAILLALAGREAEAEMRVARLAGAEVRRDPAALLDATKATGFFPGPRVAWVEDATDGVAPMLAAALDAWGEGDARILLTGGALAARGALRRLVEARPDAVAVTLYDDPPTEAEVAQRVGAAGLRPSPEARDLLATLGRALPPGEFAGLLDRLALHEADAAGPLAPATVEALAPRDAEGDVDALMAAVTDRDAGRVAAELARVRAQGATPVTVAIQAGRHLRALVAVLSDPGGPGAGLAGLRPPVGGPRRAALERAARGWRREAAERALREVVALDLRLRAAGLRGPEAALVERALLRIAAARD